MVTIDRRALLAAVAGSLLPSRSLAETGGATPVSVIELRQYTLFRGQRDVLIDLFERHFIEAQNALGATVLGTFRDLDDPDRFVWMRGFASMEARRAALFAFYGGPVWAAHRAAANPTMLDSGNVLLLRPRSGVWAAPPPWPTPRLLSITIHDLRTTTPAAFGAFFDAAMAPRLRQAGAEPFGQMVTEHAANNVPALPVREDANMFIWCAWWPDATAEARFVERWHRASGWRDHAGEDVLPALARQPERLRLIPTARSAMR